jgi:predicted TIM-barrel fold metal-dependent hydrolase
MREENVYMGTDYPYDMADKDPVASVKAAVTDEEMQHRIFGQNLSAVLGI